MELDGDEIEFSIEFAQFNGQSPKYNVAGLEGSEKYVELFADSMELPISNQSEYFITFDGENGVHPDHHANIVRDLLDVVGYDVENVANDELRAL